MKLMAILFSLSLLFSQSGRHKKMDQLSGIIGTWKLTNYHFSREGNKWKKMNSTQTTIREILGGSFIEENSTIKGFNGILTMRVTYGYVAQLNKFRISIVDKEYAVFDIFEGKIDKNAVLQVDNLKSRTPYIGKNGSEIYYRLSYDLSKKDRFEMRIEFSLDKGKKWNYYEKNVYKRVN